ncbi:Alpha/Beta hydrolase protein [Phascolomyces articulosus]|uniref:Alpha/Beta hydrolase protein n=1 Tax=Phascolomyces articulosus TaxID=60185 RepID=A0AAD5JXY2_9FUNG|nr:Alpha/Beta hydrolase protein [Phascolomyces articulosus]
MSIEPFEIPSIPPERLALLKERLTHAEYPNELEQDVEWTYGAPRWAVEPLVKAWLNDYNWETARAEMNRWHHYHATIQGLRVHFVHERSEKPDAIPLLLLNGWPSNFYEYHKVIEPLRDGDNGKQAFHVIVPSLPGFGFSEAPKLPGHGIKANGEIMHELMTTVLGYTEYMAHGTDWGAPIAKWCAKKHSTHCKAVHSSFPLGPAPTPTLHNLLTQPLRVAKLLASAAIGFDAVYGRGAAKLKSQSFVDVINDADAGYRCIQCTRPYTLGFGLTDSPVGLLAWILEKFHNWTYHTSGKENTEALPETITVDEFLTVVTIYWLSNSMASSTRIYYEFFNEKDLNNEFGPEKVKIPTALAYFPAELAKVPREWVEAGSNLQQYNEYDVGGHFPSLEVNELVVDDFQRFGKLLKTKKFM